MINLITFNTSNFKWKVLKVIKVCNISQNAKNDTRSNSGDGPNAPPGATEPAEGKLATEESLKPSPAEWEERDRCRQYEKGIMQALENSGARWHEG